MVPRKHYRILGMSPGLLRNSIKSLVVLMLMKALKMETKVVLKRGLIVLAIVAGIAAVIAVVVLALGLGLGLGLQSDDGSSSDSQSATSPILLG